VQREARGLMPGQGRRTPLIRLAVATFGIATLAATSAAGPAVAQTEEPNKPAVPAFFIYSDTSVSYSYQFTTREPNLLYAASKNVFTLNHIDAWKYGTNYLNIDLLKSDNKDPESPWGGPKYPVPPGGIGDGAFEFYGLYRGSLSFNQMFDTIAFTFGPVSDVSLFFGGDIESKNTAMAPFKRDILLGLQLAFKVPGYLNVSASFYKEWNHNGIVELQGTPPGTSAFVDYAATATFEAQYMQPLTFTGVPLKISGNTNVVLPKGTDGFGRQTVAEFVTDNRVTLDVGKFTADKPNLFDVFIGYRFWLNKFGDDPYPPKIAPIPGTMESTFYVGLTWHVF
jgi:hypothetical protein